MKKILCLLIAGVMCLLFCACGSTKIQFAQLDALASEDEDLPVVYVLSDGSPETGEEKTFSSYGEVEKYLNTTPVQALNLSSDSLKDLYPASAEKMAAVTSVPAVNSKIVIKTSAGEADSGAAANQNSSAASDAASAAAQAAAAAAQAAQAAVQASAAAEEAATAAAKANALAASLGADVPAAVSVPAAATAANTALQKVVVTKSPYGETVVPGGSTYFVSRANNATSIKWTLVNWDASVIYDAADAPYYFPGVRVSGQGTETLSFSNIPSSMNAWRVQAEFGGPGGSAWSDLAYLYVSAYTPKKDPAPCYPCSWGKYTPCYSNCVPEWMKAWTVNYGPWGQVKSCSQNIVPPSKGFAPGFGYPGSNPFSWNTTSWGCGTTGYNPNPFPAIPCAATFPQQPGYPFW